MRALAELIMSGRWQASVMALIGLPVLSPAALALVTLRRGAQDGLWVLTALVAPTFLWWVMGWSWWAYLLSTLLSSVLVYLAALMLRSTQKWPQMLLVISVVSVLSAWLLVNSLDFRADMMAMADRMEMGEIEKLEFSKLVDDLVERGVFPPAIALTVLVVVWTALLVGRWWQAQLYNPGGFREEFHSLRMEPKLVVISAVLGLVLMQAPEGGVGIIMMLFPLFVTGLGFVHWWVARKGFTPLLWVMYIGMLNPPWVQFIVVLVGLLDTALDLRKRINANGA